MHDEVASVVARVLAGQTEAFAEVVVRYQRDIWRIMASLLADTDTTQDLVQQVFVDVYLHLDQFQSNRDFGAWIRSVARNRLRKELRTRIRATRRLACYRQELLARLADEDSSSSEKDRYLEALALCKEALTPRAQEILDLRYRQSLDFEAISKRVDASVDAVRKLTQRAREQLRVCIEGRLAVP